jgi:predicted GNAT family N-acyltransferase
MTDNVPLTLAHRLGTLRVGSWSALQIPASTVRTAVFVHEQGIAADLEWDAFDALSIHVVLLHPADQPIATARLLPAQAGVGTIGRVAVLQPMRGLHAGVAVMEVLIEQARQRGDHALMLHAQQSAQGFYQRLGFAVQGEPFDEVGIPHVTMVRSL